MSNAFDCHEFSIHALESKLIPSDLFACDDESPKIAQEQKSFIEQSNPLRFSNNMVSKVNSEECTMEQKLLPCLHISSFEAVPDHHSPEDYIGSDLINILDSEEDN